MNIQDTTRLALSELFPEQPVIETESEVEEEVPAEIAVEVKTKGVDDTVVVEEEEESLRDQFVRLQADFANFRNRTQRERVELYQRANEDLLLEILPVLLASEARSVGVMGSTRRWATTSAKLIEAGVDAQRLATVRAPIGIELHAETPS